MPRTLCCDDRVLLNFIEISTASFWASIVSFVALEVASVKMISLWTFWSRLMSSLRKLDFPLLQE